MGVLVHVLTCPVWCPSCCRASRYYLTLPAEEVVHGVLKATKIQQEIHKQENFFFGVNLYYLHACVRVSIGHGGTQGSGS